MALVRRLRGRGDQFRSGVWTSDGERVQMPGVVIGRIVLEFGDRRATASLAWRKLDRSGQDAAARVMPAAAGALVMWVSDPSPETS
jgi:hypothetical protein